MKESKTILEAMAGILILGSSIKAIKNLIIINNPQFDNKFKSGRQGN